MFDGAKTNDVCGAMAGVDATPRWKLIDRQLRTIAKRRGALDCDEAMLLCEASRHEVWRRVGNASLIEYLEEVLGYGPKTARERIRIATALDEMPELADALASGELSYSAVRELTRVATRETEREWIDAVRGKNLRQVEALVGKHQRGDRPTDPEDPSLAPRVVSFRVRPATLELLRQVQRQLVLRPRRSDSAVAKLPARVGDLEAPPNRPAGAVGFARPHVDLALDDIERGQSAATEALARQETDLHLGGVEPAAVLGREVDTETPPQCAAAQPAVGGNARLPAVHAQVVDDEVDDLGALVAPGDLGQCVRKFAIAAVRRCMCEPATGERLDDAIHVGCTESPVLVVAASNLTGAKRSSRALGAVQDDRFLVEADDRLRGIKAPRVQPQHVLHAHDELLIEPRDAPHFFPATA